MIRSKNKIWLLLLMIISQIMLTGLLVYWLRSQWVEEKGAILMDLGQKFRESVDQVMDSMLVKHFIVPVLNDSAGNNRHIIVFNNKNVIDTGKQKNKITAIYKETGEKKGGMVTIALSDSSKTDQQDNVAFSTYDSSKKKMLIRSVKLIISDKRDPHGDWKGFTRMASDFPDTALLKALFEARLGNQGKQFNVRWISDTAKNNINKAGSMLYFKSDLFEKPFDAEIVHYQRIILKRISPQILFALVLLIFTGTAFFFTYRSLNKMEVLNTLRNDFISNISHELKTPVSTVTIALEALKNFDRIRDPEKSNEYLEIAFNEMKRLDQLISQVLNTSIMEHQNQYLKPEPADLIKLTQEVLNSMQVRFKQRNATVDFITAEESCILNIDKLHIQGVIVNLLDNSLKYGADNPGIKVSITKKPAIAVLTISDNGPGIPAEYLTRVFDKFFRVPKGDRHDVKGYGLGLSFADLVMRHHSGSVSVRNINEGGCEFTLTFPIPKA